MGPKEGHKRNKTKVGEKGASNPKKLKFQRHGKQKDSNNEIQGWVIHHKGVLVQLGGGNEKTLIAKLKMKGWLGGL